MDVLAASFGLSIAMLVMVAVGVALLFPIFWVWMLVDALIRDTVDYPSKDVAEKILWVVAMALVQPAAAVYFFVVWMPSRKARTAGATPAAVQPVVPGAATVCAGPM